MRDSDKRLVDDLTEEIDAFFVQQDARLAYLRERRAEEEEEDARWAKARICGWCILALVVVLFLSWAVAA